MFSREGDFGNMYRMFVSHFINSFEHKAHLEVSEAGLEQPLEMGGELQAIYDSYFNYKLLTHSLPFSSTLSLASSEGSLLAQEEVRGGSSLRLCHQI